MPSHTPKHTCGTPSSFHKPVCTLCSAANKLEDVFGEIFKVLKPGGLFLSYEWVSTKLFDPNNSGEAAACMVVYPTAAVAVLC